MTSTNTTFSEEERIDAFAKALALVLRRIAGKSETEQNAVPDDLPEPIKKEAKNKNIAQNKKAK